MDKDGLLEPGDPGYEEAKAKRVARWTQREADLKNAAHVDKGEGVKTALDKSPTPEFKSKLGKKLVDTLTKAGDKAEDLRTKKNYLSTQVHRITGRNQKTIKQRSSRIQVPRVRIQQPYVQPKNSMNDLISNKNPGRNTSSIMNDLITGQPSHKSTTTQFNDLIGPTKSDHANSMIFGEQQKSKKGKKRDPFNGLLG